MKQEQVRTVAIEMVKEAGLMNLSREELCSRAGIPNGSFTYIMGCNFTEFVEEIGKDYKEDYLVPIGKRRVPAVMRREHLLAVAVSLSKDHGYNKITRETIAEKAGVSVSLITKNFGTMNQLKRDIMRVALRKEIPEIIAQGLVNGDKRALKAPADLKAKAATLIANS